MKKFVSLLFTVLFVFSSVTQVYCAEENKKYIKWIDFNVTCAVLEYAVNADVSSNESDCHISFISLLSHLAVKYGGEFARFRRSDADSVVEKIKAGVPCEQISKNQKLYNYYFEAYSAVLGGFLGEFTEYTGDGSYSKKYGLMAFSPFAQGYYYNHYNDFGASRSFGYRRHHLGHDLLGNIGTPVIATEGGYVEAAGWNVYGGWRIGIRSYDGKRYWYYAHLRKNHPFCDMYVGKQVNAGDVIGYLGMTGYSTKENTNNINVPHLHYGLQIIFDPSQKDGTNQIWIDMYELTNFLYRNRAPVDKNAETGEFFSKRYNVSALCPD